MPIGSSTLILLSPSKTQRIPSGQIPDTSKLSCSFPQEAMQIAGQLASRDHDYFIKNDGLSFEKASKVLQLWSSWGSGETISASELYSGPAFQSLDLPSISILDTAPRLGILSALYGLVFPSDILYPYRLDFSYTDIKIDERSLRSFWKERLSKIFSEFELIIDLASREFSAVLKGIPTPCVRIDFRQGSAGGWKSISSFNKQMRGAMARHLVSEPVQSLWELQARNVRGYSYEPSLSGENEMIFTGEGALER